MGRSLTNTMINLGIQGACDEAMYQVSVIWNWGELKRGPSKMFDCCLVSLSDSALLIEI